MNHSSRIYTKGILHNKISIKWQPRIKSFSSNLLKIGPVIASLITFLDFLKNNALLNQLTNVKHSSTLVKQQSETLNILTKKNILHPELIDAHFETFSKMKDKEKVAEYLKGFLHSCSYLGHASFDMQKLTQIFRRIYKTPD